MAKAKFKEGNKVCRQYDGPKPYKVVEVKELTRYEYLLEYEDGTRFWSDEDSLKTPKKKAKGK